MSSSLKKEEIFLKEIENNPVNILKYLQNERLSRIKLISILRTLFFSLSILLLLIAIFLIAFNIFDRSTNLILLFTSILLSIVAFLFISFQNDEKEKYSKIERGLENIEKMETELKRVESINDSEEKEKLLNSILEDINIQNSVKL